MNAKRLFFSLIVLSVVAIGALGFLIFEGNKVIASKAQQIRNVHTDTNLLDVQNAESKKLAQKINELSDVSTISEKFLPQDKDQTTLLAEIFSIAKSFGITLTNVSFNTSSNGPTSTSQTEELKGAPGVRVYPFSTGIECVSYTNFMNFLERLELNKRKAQIVSLDIKPVESSTNTCRAGNISIKNLKIEVYLKNEG